MSHMQGTHEHDNMRELERCVARIKAAAMREAASMLSPSSAADRWLLLRVADLYQLRAEEADA